MKKELIAAFSLCLALTFVGCSDDSSSSSSAEDIEKIDDNGGKSGNFGKFSAIDDDAEEVLKAAVKGSDYESVTCDSVSTQIVAGTNYKFQCSIKDGKETKDVVLTVFEPLPYTKKPAQLTLVTDVDGKVLFEAEVETEDEGDDPEANPKEDCAGCIGKFSVVDDDAEKILAEAVEGTDYEDAKCDSVSTQVVAGTNYKFQCSVKDGKETKDVVLTVFEPLPYTKKPAQLTLVTDVDGKVLFEASNEDEEEQEEKSEVGLEDLCDGCFGAYEDLTAADSAVFEKANKLSDSTFVNPTAVSRQVVAGVNYKFKCELVVSKGETKEVVLEVYKNLKDEVEIISVEEYLKRETIEIGINPKDLGECGVTKDGMVTNCDVKIGSEN